jgi:hypothetical protein
MLASKTAALKSRARPSGIRDVDGDDRGQFFDISSVAKTTSEASMSENVVGAEASTADPLKSAADAMALAVQAAKDGAADAKAKVSEMIPTVDRFVSRLAYTTSYAISYGVVFPTLLLVHSIPKDNAIVHGFVDGGRAASDAVSKMRHEGEAPAAPAGEHHEPAPESHG